MKILKYILLFVAAFCMNVNAVIFYTTADATYNATRPTGDLADSGWQYVGYWGNFVGTTVGPKHFITAKHVGGSVGGIFTNNLVNYKTIKKIPHPTADLTIWEVEGTFPTWAPLYTSSDELGKRFIVYGRGLKRGSGVYVNNVLKGWKWGSRDGVLRWGENVVKTAPVGSLSMAASFDQNGLPSESHAATYDSGGSVFIFNNGMWRLAGINLTVDGQYALVKEGPYFNAAIFDKGGLYYGSTVGNQYIQDETENIPSNFYMARISAFSKWISETIGVIPPPEPTPEPPTNVKVKGKRK